MPKNSPSKYKQACESCRKTKVACLGGVPCDGCTTRQTRVHFRHRSRDGADLAKILARMVQSKELPAPAVTSALKRSTGLLNHRHRPANTGFLTSSLRLLRVLSKTSRSTRIQHFLARLMIPLKWIRAGLRLPQLLPEDQSWIIDDGNLNFLSANEPADLIDPDLRDLIYSAVYLFSLFRTKQFRTLPLLLEQTFPRWFLPSHRPLRFNI
jgi:hypothetical protein